MRVEVRERFDDGVGEVAVADVVGHLRVEHFAHLILFTIYKYYVELLPKYSPYTIIQSIFLDYSTVNANLIIT